MSPCRPAREPNQVLTSVMPPGAQPTPRRTVLMVTYHFPPSAASGSFRLLGFARHLPRCGWDVAVVAPPAQPWEPVDPDLAAQVPPETTVARVRHLEGPWALPARLCAPYVSWFPGAWAACRRVIREHRPAALLTSGPPHTVHVLGLLLKRRWGLPWVADFRDPWVAAAEDGPAPPPRLGATARLERAVLRAADGLIANAPRAGAALQAAYPELAAKVAVITNGYDPECFAAAAAIVHSGERGALAPCLESLESPPPGAAAVTIVHPGQIYAGRDPRPFLDALRDWGRSPGRAARPLRVRFLGQVERPDLDLRREAAARGLAATVAVVGQVGYAAALREMAQAEILLLLDSPGRRAGVPAKVYEYLGAGRPVLALAEPDGDLAWVLRASGTRHRIAPPGDPARIAQALAELVDRPAADSAADPGGGRGRLAFTRQATARRLAEVLEAHLESAARSGRRAAPAAAGGAA